VKPRPCDNASCGGRRRHHEDDTPRGRQTVEVPDDYPNEKPVFCSLTCAAQAGYWSATKGWLKREEES
jgi:hypothetical protein